MCKKYDVSESTISDHLPVYAQFECYVEDPNILEDEYQLLVNKDGIQSLNLERQDSTQEEEVKDIDMDNMRGTTFMPIQPSRGKSNTVQPQKQKFDNDMRGTTFMPITNQSQKDEEEEEDDNMRGTTFLPVAAHSSKKHEEPEEEDDNMRGTTFLPVPSHSTKQEEEPEEDNDNMRGTTFLPVPSHKPSPQPATQPPNDFNNGMRGTTFDPAPVKPAYKVSVKPDL